MPRPLNNDLIKWDAPLNDEEGIQWEQALTQPVPNTPNELGNSPAAYKPRYAPTSEAPTMEYSPASQPTEPYRNYSDQQLGAANQGVNIDANAGVSTYRANFAAKQEKRDAIVTQSIKDKYGPNTIVRSGVDSLSGDVEWYDPDAKQWKTAGNSAGGNIPNALPAIGEAMGGIGGAFLPAPAVSSAVGAGVGRGFGQFIKNQMGQAMGVEDDVRDQPSATSEGLKSGGINLGVNTVFSGLPAAWRLLVKGKDIVDAPTAEAILAGYRKNSTMVDEINAALANSTDKKFTLSTARQAAIPDPVSGNIDPAAANLAARESLLLGSPAMADRERERRLANESVLELYWQNEVENPHAFSNITQENWQAKLKQVFDSYKEGQLGPYQKAAEEAVTAAEQQAKQQPKIGQMNTAQSGQLIRGKILEASQASKDKETGAWANYETEAKYNPNGTGSNLKVPVTGEIMGTIRGLDEITKKALLDSQKGQASRYILNLDPGVPFKDQTMDLAMLDRTIKDLRKEGSNALRGQVAGDISDANRNRLLSNLVDARTKFMEKQTPELQTALAEAEAETVRHHTEFDRSFAGQFLVHDSAHELHVADANILNQIMKNKDIQGAQQLATLVNGEPGAKKAIVDYVHAYYNKMYTKLQPDGSRILDPKGHTRFVEEVLPYVRPFMDAADAAQIRQYGGLAKAVVRAQKKWGMAVDAWKETDSGKLGARLSTETLVQQFFDPRKSFAVTNYNFIKKRLGEEGLEKTRAGIMSELTNKARNPQTGRVDVNKLSGVVMQIKDRLGLYFGKETAENIDKYIRAAQASQRQFEVSAPSPTGATVFSEGSKAVLGPLSAENRKITFLKNLRVRSEAARLEKALYDPDELPRLIKEIESRRTNTAVKSAMGATGLALYDY